MTRETPHVYVRTYARWHEQWTSVVTSWRDMVRSTRLAPRASSGARTPGKARLLCSWWNSLPLCSSRVLISAPGAASRARGRREAGGGAAESPTRLLRLQMTESWQKWQKSFWLHLAMRHMQCAAALHHLLLIQSSLVQWQKHSSLVKSIPLQHLESVIEYFTRLFCDNGPIHSWLKNGKELDVSRAVASPRVCVNGGDLNSHL